jgi:hypothetical protein
MIVETPLQIAMDVLSSSISTALQIVSIIVSIASLAAAIWHAGTYLARPLGALCVQTFPAFQNGFHDGRPKASLSETKLAVRRAHAARVLAANFALTTCFMTLVIERIRHHDQVESQRILEQRRSGQPGYVKPEARSLWVVGIVLLSRATLEGLLVLAMLSGIVRVLKLV